MKWKGEAPGMCCLPGEAGRWSLYEYKPEGPDMCQLIERPPASTLRLLSLSFSVRSSKVATISLSDCRFQIQHQSGMLIEYC